jgi:hypothetical protein
MTASKLFLMHMNYESSGLFLVKFDVNNNMVEITTWGNYGLGNALFINIGVSILAEKHNLRVKEYPRKYMTDEMGVSLFEGGEEKHPLIHITDAEICDIIERSSVDFGIKIDGYFQTKRFIQTYNNKIRSFFDDEPEKLVDRVFVVVRLGSDAIHQNPGIEYYRTALRLASCKGGCIASDVLSHDMVTSLSREFNLELVHATAADTIKLSRAYDKLVLSNGTFSWWIGFLNYSGRIYYPKIKNVWHGDIFGGDNWIEVDH